MSAHFCQFSITLLPAIHLPLFVRTQSWKAIKEVQRYGKIKLFEKNMLTVRIYCLSIYFSVSDEVDDDKMDFYISSPLLERLH